MGESGKRYRHHRDDLDNKNQRMMIYRGREINENGNDELRVHKILCHDGVVGSVIEKNGKVINSIWQDSRAKVKVVDPFSGAKDRVILTYCYVIDKEDVVIDAMIAEGVRVERTSFDGDLQSISWMTMAFGGICGSLLGGYALKAILKNLETLFLDEKKSEKYQKRTDYLREFSSS